MKRFRAAGRLCFIAIVTRGLLFYFQTRSNICRARMIYIKFNHKRHDFKIWSGAISKRQQAITERHTTNRM
jgi:hypothetical protein